MQKVEERNLRRLIRRFSAEMREKLLNKASRGWSGCDNKAWRGDLEVSLMKHIARAMRDPKQWIDVANLAAFLWSLENPDGTQTRSRNKT